MSRRGKQSELGFHFLAPSDSLAERARLAVTTTRCGFCGATHEGTAEAGREWAAQHREAFHPAAKDRGQRARLDAAKRAPKVIAAVAWSES